MIYESTLRKESNTISLKPALEASPGIFSLISILLIFSIILGAIIIMKYLMEHGLQGYYIEAINSLPLLYSISAFVFVICILTTALAIIIPRAVKNELYDKKEETRYLASYLASMLMLALILYKQEGDFYNSYLNTCICFIFSLITTYITKWKPKKTREKLNQNHVLKKASFIQISITTFISFIILLFIISIITIEELKDNKGDISTVTLTFLIIFFLAKCAVIISKENKNVEIGIITFLFITINYLSSGMPSLMTKGLINQANGFYLIVDGKLLERINLNKEKSNSVKLKNPDIYLRTTDKYIIKINDHYVVIPRSSIQNEGID